MKKDPKKMIDMISNTREEELSCDDVHARIAQYADMALAGENVDEFLPLVSHHLDMCPDCREEYEALLKIIASQHDK